MSNIGSNNCDRMVHVYHSYEHAAQNNAPPARLRSLKQKRALYDDISRRMRRGLYPEDVLPPQRTRSFTLRAPPRSPSKPSLVGSQKK